MVEEVGGCTISADLIWAFEVEEASANVEFAGSAAAILRLSKNPQVPRRYVKLLGYW